MGYNIEKIRKEKKMSQEELAEMAKVSRATISGLESGRVQETTIGTLRKIAKALGVDVVEHQFECTNREHILINAEEIFLGILRLFFFNSLVVLVNRDIRKFDISGLSHLIRIYINGFWHITTSLNKFCLNFYFYLAYFICIISKFSR